MITRVRPKRCLFYSSCGTSTSTSTRTRSSAFSTSTSPSPSPSSSSSEPVRPNPTHVNLTHAPKDFDLTSAVVYDNFISPLQGNKLQKDILNLMKQRRKRFEKGHWDAVITQYKEIELPPPPPPPLPQSHQQLHQQSQLHQQRRALSKESYEVIDKVRCHIEQTHFCNNNNDNNNNNNSGNNKDNDKDNDNYTTVPWLQPHAIYLKENGVLSAHVDSVKFSGYIVAGLSLLSPSIMRLKPASPSEIVSLGQDYDDDDADEEEEDQGNSDSDRGENIDCNSHDKKQEHSNKCLDNVGHVDLYLPPLSLYILSGESRFQYTHELLDSGETFVLNDDEEIVVHRKDRISVIFRDAKKRVI